MTRDAFSACHPVLNFIYFAFVILVSIFVLHPVILFISFAAATAYAIRLKGGKAVRFSLLGLLPMMLVAAAINPLFNHAGVTILVYMGGNPITLESILYGLASAAMLGTVIQWFSCYNVVMTSDKFIYLFGRVIPALSLVLSMALRFVPRYTDQVKKVTAAQKCLGRSLTSGSLMQRAKTGMMILSIVTTWALENAIETADSMRSRGFGLKGRTAYSLYRLTKRDKVMLVVLILLLVFILGCMAVGVISIRYFPSILMNAETPLSIVGYVGFAAVCFFPLILEGKEAVTWRSLLSKT